MKFAAPLNNVRRVLSALAALTILLGALCVAPRILGAQGVSFRFVNRTRWSINYIYMSSSSDPNWGEDHLGSSVLPQGNSFTLRGLDPDNYDIKTVDQDGDQCIRRGVPVFRSTQWVITNQPYLNCISRSRGQ